MKETDKKMKEMDNEMNGLKKEVFYRLLDMAGRVFVFVRYSGDAKIGRRGFLPEEKKNGIILVFNGRMNFSWEDDAITARLVFGAAPEDCYIPVKDIVSVYSPELQTQLITAPEGQKTAETGKDETHKENQKVIKVDFGKRAEGSG
jgi:hypothetical protein